MATPYTSAVQVITTAPDKATPTSTAGKSSAMSYQASVEDTVTTTQILEMSSAGIVSTSQLIIAMSSSVYEIIPTSEKVTPRPPTSKEPQTEEPTTEEPEKTEEPDTEEPKTELIIELRIKREWDNDLQDENSKAYKKLSLLLEKEIRGQYSQDDDFIGVKIVRFKEGSVVAEFKLMFKSKLKNEEALAPLKAGIQDGKMGTLNVDPESLEIKEDIEEPTEVEEKEKEPYPLIIGVSLGGIFLIAVVIILLRRYCQRHPRINSLHALDAMPAEPVFSRAERYEMSSTKSKEDIVRYEEIGISNAAVHYEELGNTKDHARYEMLAFSSFKNDAAFHQNASIPGDASDNEEMAAPNDAGYYQEVGNSNEAGCYDEIAISKKAEQE